MPCGFVTCGPNTALVVSGMCHSRPLLVSGGRVFVYPCVQQVQELSLKIMTLQIDSELVYSSQGVPITVEGVAQVKIEGQNKDMLLIACEQFLGKTTVKQIERVAKETLEGHQRSIIGSMTVEEIYKDRKTFSKHVYEVASADLQNMGITVVSYTIRDVRDDRGYLESLGMARTAEVQRDARIGEAEARRDGKIKAAIAEQERMDSKYKNDTLIAQAKRDYELQKAAYDAEVNTKNAEASMAYELQVAVTQQAIRAEKMQVKVVERMQQIELADQEIERKQKELDATVKKPAEAEKYRLEKLAEANQKRVVLEAEAEAEALRLKGQAEADAVAAKGKAQAEMLAMKADAYRHYKEAAIVEMILEALPKVAAEVAAPLSNVESIRMVSTGGEIGPARLTTEVLEAVLRMPQLVSTVTGFDITKVLKQ